MSPYAVSLTLLSAKTMLPLRPVWMLEYSPSHWPTSELIATGSAMTRTGVGEDAQAHAPSKIAPASATLTYFMNPPFSS
jgi:hypothetical protein